MNSPKSVNGYFYADISILSYTCKESVCKTSMSVLFLDQHNGWNQFLENPLS